MDTGQIQRIIDEIKSSVRHDTMSPGTADRLIGMVAALVCDVQYYAAYVYGDNQNVVIVTNHHDGRTGKSFEITYEQWDSIQHLFSYERIARFNTGNATVYQYKYPLALLIIP